MATNGRPVTRINVNYGSLGTVAEARALSPVLIAPRYILHSHKDGYADGYLGKYDITDNKLKNLPWPAAEISGTRVDIGSAKLFIEKPYVELNDIAIDGTASTNSNEITLTEAIQGDDKSESLGVFSVYVGDRVDLEGSAGTVAAKITGIGKAELPSFIDTTPAPVGETTSLISAGGSFIGSTDCVYLLTVSEVSDNGIVVSVRAIEGDSGFTAAAVELSATAISIGNCGIEVSTVSGETYKVGDCWKVAGYAKKATSSRIIYVDKVLSSAENTVSCKFSSNRYSSDFVKLDDSFTVTQDAVTVLDTLKAPVGGVSRKVVEGSIYVDYRELVTTGSLSLVSSIAEGAIEWAGVADPQNPMGMMATVARGVEGSSFFMLATEGTEPSDYVKAINYVAQFETAYALVPYSNNEEVRSALIAVINKYAAPEIAQFKRAWVSSTVSQNTAIYSKDNEGGALLASMSSDGVVTVASGNLIEGGVAPGDFLVVYGSYDQDTGSYEKVEYEVYRIINDTSVQVRNGKKIDTTQVEFIRKMDNVEYAEAVANEAKTINAVRVNLVWGDSVSALGYNNLPLSIACAALAAQRSALPPHAPMTDLAVPGISTVDGLKFSDTEYEIMNAGGVWIIHNDSDGRTVTYHQITTRTDGTLAEEDSCVSNGDAVIRYFRSTIRSMFNGSMNVHDDLIPIVESQLVAQAEAIKVLPFPDVYGPLLINFSVDEIYRPDSNKGSIMVKCSAEMGRPYAGGDFTFNLI